MLKKTLESPLDSKGIQLVQSKGDQSWVFFGRTDAKAETPVLRPPHVKSWLIGKDSDSERDWGQEEKGTTEAKMAGWHHWLDGHEVEWTPGVGDGQGGLACCNSWGRKELDTTEWLNWTELKKNFKINSSNHPSFYSVHRRGSWVSQQVKCCTMHYFKTISEPANFSLNINHVIKMKFMILHSEEKEIT